METALIKRHDAALSTLSEIKFEISDEWQAKANALATSAAAITVVESDSDLEESGKRQTELAKAIKEIEGERMKITRPIDGLKKSIMDTVAALATPIKNEHDRLRKMNNAYATEKARRAEEERRRIAEEERKRIEAETQERMRKEAEAQAAAQSVFGEGAKVDADAVATETEQPPVITPTPIPRETMPQTSANKFVEVWEFEVVDPEKVPRELCEVSMSKVRSAVQYHKSLGRNVEDVVIPGVRIFKKMSVRAR